MPRFTTVSVILAMVVAGLAVWFFWATSDSGTGFRLRLVVRDSVTGEPVPGAAFSLVRDGRPYVRSEQDLDSSVKQPMEPSDELLVAAYGYELYAGQLGPDRTVRVDLVPCDRFHTLDVSRDLADHAGTRVSVVQSLRRDPEVMLIHTSKKYLFRDGDDHASLPVPRGLVSKAMALHEGGKPTNPYGFWLVPGGYVAVSSVPLKSLRVRVVDEDGAAHPIGESLLIPDLASGSGLAPSLLQSRSLRHLAKSHEGVPEGGGVRFEQLPPVPMHLFVRTALGWGYGAVSGAQVEVELAASEALRTITSIEPHDKSAEQEGWVLPGRLDLACIDRLRVAGLLRDIGAQLSTVQAGAVNVLVAGAGLVTIWSPVSGVWYGAVEKGGRLRVSRQPGSVVFRVDPRTKGTRHEIWLTPIYGGQGDVYWRNGSTKRGAMHRTLGAGSLTVEGLPLATYRVVVVQLRDSPENEGKAARREESRQVELTEDRPGVVLQLTDRGLDLVD